MSARALNRPGRWPAWRAAAALALLGAAMAAGAAQDILKPEQAFPYTVRADADRLLLRWDIEPAHYLYKERMSFRSATDGVELGPAVMPAGKAYDDEFFGPMEIYRGRVDIEIPIIARAPGADVLELEIRSQGCADAGLCYPPQRWIAPVDLGGPAGGVIGRLLGGGPAGGPDEPLPVDQAFRPTVEVLDPFRIAVDWQIEPGYYLYRDSFAVAATGDAARTGPPSLPRGTAFVDEHFGDTEVYFDRVRIEIPLVRPRPEAGLVELALDYQGCKQDSICYPPATARLEVALPAADGAPPPVGPVSEQDRLSALIVDASPALVMLTFLGLGLLLAFTPCVLPMVPILSGIIAGQGKDVTTGRAFALSLTYVLGMALTYTAAGAGFAAAGGQLQAALQKPWIIVGVAALFVALALAMFGFYELQMPSAIQNRLTAATQRQRRGSFIGTAIMGALSALVVTTCVAPPLVATLTVIGQSGDVVRGASALFAMSIGMGLPLLVIGTSAGRLLPRAGAWMDRVKGAFGFMMLGLAIWMLERILPGSITLALWAILVFMAGVFLGGLATLPAEAGTPAKLGKGFGLLAVLYGAALLLGALGGAQDPLQPLRFAAGPAGDGGERETLAFRPVKTVAELDAAVAAAAARGQPLMLDFYADWCVSCKEMERYTFSTAEVRASLDGAVLLKADVTANDAADQALLQRFGIYGPPTIVFFDAAGIEQPGYRVVGFMPADEFAAHARSALGAG